MTPADAAGIRADRRVRVGGEGWPRFEPGEEVVLFLEAEDETGRNRPIGLGQGKFSISTDEQGQALAVNADGNKHLFRKLSGKARERLGATLEQWRDRDGIDPDVLLDMVIALGN